MVRNQHFIPVFYQKYWESERQGYVWGFEKNYSNQGIRQFAISHNCSKEYLYEGDSSNPTNTFENLYKEFETRAAKPYSRFVNSRNCIQRVDRDSKELLSDIYSNFSARHERNLYGNLENHRLASFFTLGEKDKTIDRRYILNVISLSNSRVYEGVESEFGNQLISYNLEVLVSHEPKILFFDCITQQIHYKGEYFFPICPTMVARFTDDENSVDGAVRSIQEEEYKRYIEMYVLHPLVTKVFSSEKDILERIVAKYF